MLTQFEQAGLLIRHHFETGKAVFELNQGGHHDHLVCVQCGHVEEFFDAEIEKRQEKIAKDRGFKIHDHSLHIYADCIKDNCPHRQSSPMTGDRSSGQKSRQSRRYCRGSAPWPTGGSIRMRDFAMTEESPADVIA